MDLEPFYTPAFAAGTTLALLLVLQLGTRLRRGPTLAKDLASGNPARRIFRVGQVLAAFLLSASVVEGSVEGESVVRDIVASLGFGVLGLVLVELTAHLQIRLLLRGGLMRELDRGNVAAGVAGAASVAATAIITSHALVGNDLESVGWSLAFFGIAQLTLVLFVALFRALTTYDDAEQIQGENLAAALSYGGVALAIALVVARALDGDFDGFWTSLRDYAAVLGSLLVLYPVRQLFVQTILLHAPLRLRGGKLDVSIGTERSAATGALEAVSYVATALTIVRLA